MELQQRINAFVGLGSELKQQLSAVATGSEEQALNRIIRKAYQQNQWFTPESAQSALMAIADLLTQDKLNEWCSGYPALRNNNSPKTVGLVMAGNIPMVGFHDVMCVLLIGNTLKGKLSKDDALLIPFLLNLLITIEPLFTPYIQFVERLETMDAVIATGSNNSARYFDYYFSKYPHIIRRNRNSAAVITGNETITDLQPLGSDVFTYFGLGCRNVSKLYVPVGYDFDTFFKAMQVFSGVMQHNKYMNNFDYYNSILLLKQVPFLTNNFLIVKEDIAIATPVSVLNFTTYHSLDELNSILSESANDLQCVVSANAISGLSVNTIPFGTTQQPGLMDYADQVDTMQFLISL